MRHRRSFGTRWMSGGAILVALILVASPAGAADDVLGWDDGRKADHRSMAGAGHVVSFEVPKGERWLHSVRIHGSRYGGGYDPATTTFTVTVCDENLHALSETRVPYACFAAGRFDWVDAQLDRALLVRGSFKIVVSFDPTRTRGVYVGLSKTEESHSGQGLPGGEETPLGPDKEWMIRALVARKVPKGMVKQVDLRADDGARIGKRSIAGGGHAVELRKPSGTWWIEAVLVCGQRYGGGYDPAKTTFEVAIADKRMKPTVTDRAPYALFSTREFAWVPVPLTEPPKAPSTFRVVADFDPAATRGVYVGYTAPASKKTHAFVGRVGSSPSTFRDGTWMIRARLVSEKPEPGATAEAVPADTAGAAGEATYVKDLEHLARTVRDHFPALEKKGVDWTAAVDAWQPRFEAATSDAEHVLNARRLLALLGDSHTGVTAPKVEAHVPTYDGLYSAGLWIATDRGQLVLRGLMPGHALSSKLEPGARLLEVDGRPARVVHEELRERLRTWSGWSSEHFLDARLSWQFFPFGERRTLPATFLNPDGRVLTVDLPRWGPQGRGTSRAAISMPEGVELGRGKRAVAARLAEGVGYLRILGGMDDATRKEMFAALDSLKGVEGLLLDCRGMGGGGDPAAWAMAGRFFSKRRPLAHDPAIRPTGTWQFDGPIVMLQDERMVSSAETFTWALAETDRAITVGRPTGGATIIPRTFDVPSGLFRFRLGVRDRETSVEGVRPEGIGTLPDVFVPYADPLLVRAIDPVLATGYDMLRLVMSGADRDVVVGAYAGVLEPSSDRLEHALGAFRKLTLPENLRCGDFTRNLVDELVHEEIRVSDAEDNPMPDFVGASARLDELAAVAAMLGRAEAERAAREAPERWAREADAQIAYELWRREGRLGDAKAARAFAETYEGTRYADAVLRAFP